MKVVSVIGTRPQLVKAAVVTRALRDDALLDEVTIDTGQHYDHELSDVLLADLGDVRRTRVLDVDREASTVPVGPMIDAVADAIRDEAPAIVVVYGDTNSTLAGALAASRLEIPVAHVEAGLRSHNPAMREEHVRVRVDHLSELLLCPTTTAVANLHDEGVDEGVHHVGDVMFDAALAARAAVQETTSDLLERLGVEAGRYAVATVHRAETTDDTGRLDAVLRYLRARTQEAPVVFPVHPRTRKAIEQQDLSTAGLVTIPPVGYFDMVRLLGQARVVYTDSGGLQKEAYFLRVPCVTLRSETEWTETVEAGWNRLWTVDEYLPRREITDYGDGEAGKKIAALLATTLVDR